jgi:TrmH family RNA methyltransferase
MSLSVKKHRTEMGRFVVEGIHLVNEALDAGLLVELYHTSAFLRHASAGRITDRAASSGIAPILVSEAELSRIVDVMTPVGVAAVVKSPEQDVSEILEGSPARIVLLDEVRDPGNVGTIIRTAKAFGFDAVVVSARSAEPTAPKVVRSTAGAIFRIPVEEGGEAPEEAARLARNGLSLFVAVAKDGVDYRTVNYGERMAMVVGNETVGPAVARARVPATRVTIPMAEGSESLNVAVAAGILLARAGAV